MKKKTITEQKGAELFSYSVEVEGKAYEYKLQSPNFAQLSAALTESIGLNGKINMTGGGKVIWELCVAEYSEEIEQDARLLMAVCLDIYNRFVLPVDAEIKKK